MKQFLVKKEALFLQEFLRKEFEKDFPFTFMAIPERGSKNSFIEFSPMLNHLDPDFSHLAIMEKESTGLDLEKTLKQIKTTSGLKKKINAISEKTGQRKFVITNKLLEQLEDVVLSIHTSTVFWNKHQEVLLKFIDFACQRTKEEKYQFNYVNLVHHLIGENLLSYCDKNDGFLNKVDRILDKYYFPDINFFGYTENAIETNYISNNLDYFLLKSLKVFFELDNKGDALIKDKNWIDFYFKPYSNILKNHSIVMLKHYHNNNDIKSDLDFLIAEFKEELPLDIVEKLEIKKVGKIVNITNDIFVKNEYLHSHFIVVNMKAVANEYPAQITAVDFNQKAGKILAGVIGNLTNNTEVECFNDNNKCVFQVNTNLEKNKDEFEHILLLAAKKLNILNVESSMHVIIDRVSTLVNNDLMLEENTENKILTKVKKL